MWIIRVPYLSSKERCKQDPKLQTRIESWHPYPHQICRRNWELRDLRKRGRMTSTKKRWRSLQRGLMTMKAPALTLQTNTTKSLTFSIRELASDSWLSSTNYCSNHSRRSGLNRRRRVPWLICFTHLRWSTSRHSWMTSPLTSSKNLFPCWWL